MVNNHKWLIVLVLGWVGLMFWTAMNHLEKMAKLEIEKEEIYIGTTNKEPTKKGKNW